VDPEQVTEAVNRLLAHLRPFEVGRSSSSSGQANGVTTLDKTRVPGMADDLLPVKDVDRDQIRLLARRGSREPSNGGSPVVANDVRCLDTKRVKNADHIADCVLQGIRGLLSLAMPAYRAVPGETVRAGSQPRECRQLPRYGQPFPVAP
jgi:hypothetical protein